ncbi:MAG: hypothetical protein PHE88_01550 [Elusimicrobia bacterium]|nr:hypothetical protein [Elusimicrobiota bacterium]
MNFLVLPIFLFISIFGGCSLSHREQQKCKVIYSQKSNIPVKTVAILPVVIGFDTEQTTQFIPIVNSPFIIEDKSRDWLGRREERIISDRATTEKISQITAEYFYNILLKKKKLNRIVHPDSVRNIMESKNINLGDFKQIDELNKVNSLNKLLKLTQILEVEALIIPVIKKQETEVVYRNISSTERSDFGESRKSMSYSYKFELEAGVFVASENKFIWIGDSRETRSNSTPELEQNIIVAIVTNGFERFFRRYVIEKIMKEEPEYRCVLKIINTLPF